MINAWNLVWIIPVAASFGACLGFMIAAILSANGRDDNEE